MALWHILLTASVFALGGAGVLYVIEQRKGSSNGTKEVAMPAFSLLGTTAKEYNAREVRIPEPKAPVHIIRQKGNDYEELPLPTTDETEITLKERQTDERETTSPATNDTPQKKKDDDWTPIDFFGEEKQ